MRVELSVGVSPVRDDRGTSAATTTTIGLDLHPRWIAWRESGREVTLDFDARRCFERDPAAGSVDGVPLIADAHFRAMELANRAHVRAVAAAGGATLPGFGPVFTEHQVSTLDPARRTTLAGGGVASALRSMFGGTPRSDIERRDAGGEARYVHAGHTLFAYALRGFAASSAHVRALSQFIRYRFSGHPLVLERLASESFIPASLRLGALRPSDLDGGVVTVRVISVAEIDAEPPPRAGRFAIFDQTRERVDAHIERLRAPGFGDRRRPPGERVEAAVSAARAGRVFEAMTAFLTLALEREVTMPPSLGAALDATDEPRARALLELLRRPRDADDARAMRRALTELRRGDDEHPEFLLTQEAVLCRSYGDRAGAIARYCDALDHNPFLLGVYKDLGDCHLADYQVPRAWRCWEAARHLCATHPMLREIDDLERRLVAANAEYLTAPGDDER